MDKSFDFSGWATRANVKCSDGRTIMPDAFKHCDGQKVPLVWNHDHSDSFNVLGHALLENRADGVYTYGTFNDTEQGQNAKRLVENGDVVALSIYANKLKQQGGNVCHGVIREVSLVLAGANPEAYIDTIIRHGDELDDEAYICMYEGESMLCHSDEDKETTEMSEELKHEDKPEADKGKTVQDIIDGMTEEQQTVMYGMIGQAIEDTKNELTKGDDENMKHNVFDQKEMEQGTALSHSDEAAILELARKPGVGSFREALNMYIEENEHLAHSFDDETIESLFPDFKLVKPGAPELIERDQSWVSHVMSKVHKSPFARIRTRQMDVRNPELRAFGYEKGKKKVNSGVAELLTRTTEPQTIYRVDSLHRDDILDITDFDIVAYQYGIMKQNLLEEIATAILIGDGREVEDEFKIKEQNIRSIWNDDELYTIHYDIDIAKAKSELQGSETAANFGENYIYAEAIVTAALYSREQYKGSGSLEFYCTPHLLNVMLLARDLNGRRIYSSKSDLAAALNVTAIHTVEQFEGKVRKDKAGKDHKLLGLFVNLADYQVGSTKGGEITRFEDFDIDYNQYKYLIETRMSGAPVRVKSFIALEEPVAAN